MSLTNKTVTDFIEQVDSNNPTPGGGSVSALVSTLGAALSGMLGKLTVNKKAFKKADLDVQEQFQNTLAEIEETKAKLLGLVDEDTEAFNHIMAAFKLPKETEEEKQARREAIQKATLGAIDVPHKVAKESLSILQHCEILVEYGNKNAVSDVGVGILLLSAGIEGALLNIQINLDMLKDSAKVTYYTKEIERINTIQSQIKTDLIPRIKDKIN